MQAKPLSTGKGRREHYVPRFYLDFFGESLFGFDKLTGNVFPTVSKNIALERGFYDLDPKIDLEAVIAENESRMRFGISELIDKRNPIAISEEARIVTSLFIALQFVRTKEYRAMVQESGGKLMTEIVKSNPEFKDDDFNIVMKDELAKVLQAQTIAGSYAVPEVGWTLGHSLWTLLVNRTSVPFWTSDNPVALFNPSDRGVGFAVTGNQTHFPLNEKLLLLILDPVSYNSPPVKIVKQREAVLYENTLQLYSATRFVISSHDDFLLAKRIRQEDATLRKPQERVILRRISYSGKAIPSNKGQIGDRSHERLVQLV